MDIISGWEGCSRNHVVERSWVRGESSSGFKTLRIGGERREA